MPLLDHLGELRRRLVISVGAIMGGSIVGWFLYHPIFKLLTNPFCGFMRSHPQFAANPKHPCALFFMSVVEPFMIRLKVTVFTGIVIALPIVLFQFWQFVTPALR